MPTYSCLCCRYTQTFDSPDAAFHAGWDVAPRFTVQPLCNLCPSAPFVLLGLEGARRRHAELHATWQRNGRPEDFDVATELAADGATVAEIERHKAEIERLRNLFEPKKH